MCFCHRALSEGRFTPGSHSNAGRVLVQFLHAPVWCAILQPIHLNGPKIAPGQLKSCACAAVKNCAREIGRYYSTMRSGGRKCTVFGVPVILHWHLQQIATAVLCQRGARKKNMVRERHVPCSGAQLSTFVYSGDWLEH